MSNVSMKAMLEAGVHFGHQTSRWNPKMGRFIFGERNGVHILDLQKTAKELKKACAFVKEESKKGAKFLFVGTKKQAQEAIQQEAERCGMYYMNSRWLGGTLTNNKTIRTRIDRLNKLDAMEKSGEFDLLPKKEVIGLQKEREKLQDVLGGIREMSGLPGVMFVVDPHHEEIAVKEAKKLGIPVVAITDTNCDPTPIDYVIPGNDDAIRAVKLIASIIADAVIEANQGEDAVRRNVEEVTSMAEVEVTDEQTAEAEAEGEAAVAETEAKAQN